MIKKIIEKLFWRFYDSDVKVEDFDNEEMEGVFLEISLNEKLPELLKAMMKGDKTRYFRATDDRSRDIIRGEYLRTLFFYRKIQPKKSVVKRSVKLDNKRYG